MVTEEKVGKKLAFLFISHFNIRRNIKEKKLS